MTEGIKREGILVECLSQISAARDGEIDQRVEDRGLASAVRANEYGHWEQIEGRVPMNLEVLDREPLNEHCPSLYSPTEGGIVARPMSFIRSESQKPAHTHRPERYQSQTCTRAHAHAGDVCRE